jgi:hypothetical protein
MFSSVVCDNASPYVDEEWDRTDSLDFRDNVTKQKKEPNGI